MDKKFVYLIGFGFIILALMISGFLLTTSTRNDPVTTESDIRNISVIILEPPEISVAGEVMNISYTLETSRFEDNELTLTRVEVLNKDTREVISELNQESLVQVYSPADELHNPEISLTLQINQESVPKELTHRLTFISDGRAILPFSVTAGDIQI